MANVRFIEVPGSFTPVFFFIVLMYMYSMVLQIEYKLIYLI